jgi:hypothetical protein
MHSLQYLLVCVCVCVCTYLCLYTHTHIWRTVAPYVLSRTSCCLCWVWVWKEAVIVIILRLFQYFPGQTRANHQNPIQNCSSRVDPEPHCHTIPTWSCYMWNGHVSSLSKQLNLWDRVFYEKWILIQLVEKFLAFRNSDLYHRVYRSPPSDHLRSQMNPVHTFTPKFTKIHFSIFSIRFHDMVLS